jgi:hypothetical protein
LNGLKSVVKKKWAALSLVRASRIRGDAKVPMILDSLGELHKLRGDMDQVKDYLCRAVAQEKQQLEKGILETVSRKHRFIYIS